MASDASMQQRAEQFRQAYGRLQTEIGKVIVGHEEIIHGVLTCLFVGGHVLLEGVPGLGKTLLVRTLAQVLDLKFARVQFTPDLMPSGIAGTIHKLEEPFFVLATQNPIEQEGTYPLPEAQLDRFFFKLLVPFSTREDLNLILDRTTRNEWPKPDKVMDGAEVLRWQGLVREVLVAPPVQDYAIR